MFKHSVHWGINLPEKHPPSFSPSPPPPPFLEIYKLSKPYYLNYPQIIQAPFYQIIQAPYISVFCELLPLKIGFFSEPT